MLRIMTHIERLLLVHDCVIIPGVGGFVLQTEQASFNEKEGSFIPQRKDVVFNSTLKHNDGLLTESYMRLYGVDFRKAGSMQEEDTRELQAALVSKRRIALGAMGAFLVKDEVVVFEPGEAAPFSISSYGLAAFHMPLLQSLQPLQAEKEVALVANVTKRVEDTIYIPVNRTFIRIAVASAAAVALFLLLSTPVKEVSPATYTASFIPSAVVSRPDVIVPEPVMVQEIAESAPKALVSEPKAVTAVVAKAAVPAPVTNEIYHIVIASFPTKGQADKFFSSVDKKRYTLAGVVDSKTKARVYAARFADRTQAENYLAKLKDGNQYKDAWLFIAR